jgi:hypothetical protein
MKASPVNPRGPLADDDLAERKFIPLREPGPRVERVHTADAKGEVPRV